MPVTEPATTKNRNGSADLKGSANVNAKANMSVQIDEISPIGSQNPYNTTGA